MYRAMGQTTEKPSGDPFVFTSEKVTCLKGTWPSYALLCAQSREGTLDPKFAPSEAICNLFLDPAHRAVYSRTPICWEHGVDPEATGYGQPIYPWDVTCDKADKEQRLDEIGSCLKDPASSERCALYEHPEVQVLLSQQCGMDLYKEARSRAQAAELKRALLIIGGAVAVGGVVYVMSRKKP